MYKSRIHLGETVGVLESSACSAGCCWENCTRYIQESLQKYSSCQKNCNHGPMFTLHIAGLRVDKSKSLIFKSWNIVWRERTQVPKFVQRNTIDHFWQSKNIHFYTFILITPKLSTATDDIRSPNTMSSVTFSRRWVNISSSLSSSQTSLG